MNISFSNISFLRHIMRLHIQLAQRTTIRFNPQMGTVGISSQYCQRELVLEMYRMSHISCSISSVSSITVTNIPYTSGYIHYVYYCVTHWGRMTHICFGNLSIIGSDNGCQAIIWTKAWMLLIWPLGTNFGENLVEIHTFLLNKIHLKMTYEKWRQILSRPQCINALS